MNRYRLLLYGKRLFLLLLLAGLVLLVYLLIRFFAGEKINPQNLLSESLQKSLSSSTFRYSMEVKTGKQGYLSKVDGEWLAPERIHIKGNMFNTPVEFIQIGDVTYMRDIWTKKWLELRSNKLGQAQLFIMELGPLNFLNFGNVSDARISGREKIKEGKMLVLECRPQLTGSFFGQETQEYNCKLWIDPKDHRIRQVLLQAPAGSSDLPTVTLKFWDYGQPITIEPPAINSGSISLPGT